MPRSNCPVAIALEIIGDRWSLLVVRDMLLLGKRHYGEFLDGPEGISTNILADRLKRLEEAGMITKQIDADARGRPAYYLTPKGKALAPVIDAIMDWASKWLPRTSA